MRYIVRLGNNLFVESMESGVCRRTKIPSEGAIEERLTRGQLRILSYLVKNRLAMIPISISTSGEIVCR